MPILEVEHISKSFNKTPVLKDVGFNLEKGQGRNLIGNISDAVRYIGLSPKETKLITQDHIIPFFINIDGNAGHFRNFTE